MSIFKKTTGELAPTQYWRRPAEDLPRDYWVDPDPGVRGMLAADRIQYYVDKFQMIQRFDPKFLKPASYGLRLGPLYQINGREKILTDARPWLTIPRNSIVFVSMIEALRLPHYIAARFNLAITLVYKGLLLGTGPQVDPGFQGVLSCPLHNISRHAIKIRLGHHLATIDFVKTTGFTEESRHSIEKVKSEKELYDNILDIRGKDGHPYELFVDKKRWLEPIYDYGAGDKQVSSSVAYLDRSVRRLRRRIRFGVAAVLSFVVALILLAATLYSIISNDLHETQNRVRQLEELQQDMPVVNEPKIDGKK